MNRILADAREPFYLLKTFQINRCFFVKYIYAFTVSPFKYRRSYSDLLFDDH